MKVHIFVATTQGLVAIQNITVIDDADISSIVSINGTSTMANISSAYHSFVKKGAGVIHQDFGACSYRINISKRIDHGNSWQLAFYLAHAAESKGILGDGQVKRGDTVICATGEINTVTKDIQAISQVACKQKLSATDIKKWHKQSINVSFLMPYTNAKDLDKKLPLNIKLVRNLTQALSYLPLTTLANTRKNQTSSKLDDSLNAVVDSERWLTKRPSGLILYGILLIFILLFLSMNYWFSTETNRNRTQTQNDTQSKTKSNNQQAWQIVLLNQTDDTLDENLEPAYALIEKTITEQLIANNFDVADKKLTLGINNVSEDTLFQLTKHKINLAIRFNLTVNKLDKPTELTKINGDTWYYELSAYLIDLTTKRSVETHTEYGEYTKQLIHCDKQCFSQWLASNARKLAQDMGAILTVKLNNLPRRYQFELVFKNFLVEELQQINNQLNANSGVVSSNLLQVFDVDNTSLSQASSRRYLYTSYHPIDELTDQLDTLFEETGIAVIKTNQPINNSGNTLTFSRDSTPYVLYVILSVILFIVLLTLLFVMQRKYDFSLFSFALWNKNQLTKMQSEPINQEVHTTNGLSPEKNIIRHTTANIIKQQPISIPEKGLVIGAVKGQGKLKNVYIFPSNTLKLGRVVVDPISSFSIGYQQISRVGKQCEFTHENNSFYIEDQGSTNGSFFNNSPLLSHKKTIINKTSTLTLGGETTGDIAACQLTLKIPSPQSTALILELNQQNHQFIDLSKLQAEWPTMTEDSSSRWVLLATEVSLGIDNGQIVLGCDKNDTVAYLLYQDGFYIRPNDLTTTHKINRGTHNKDSINDMSKETYVMIDRETIHNTMPIVENAVISLSGYEFSLQSLVKT